MRVKISVTLDAETVRAMDRVGGPRSRFIEGAVREALERHAQTITTAPLAEVTEELVDILLDHVQVDGNGSLV
jgi:hypothetical protein